MSSLRTIAVIVVPAVTAIFGLLWLFGKKKPPSPRKPPDKNSSEKSLGISSKAPVTTQESNNGSAGKHSVTLPTGKSDADAAALLQSSSQSHSAVGSTGDTNEIEETGIMPKTDASQTSSFAFRSPVVEPEDNISRVESSLQSASPSSSAAKSESVVISKAESSASVEASIEEMIIPCKSTSSVKSARPASPKQGHSHTSSLSQDKSSEFSYPVNLSQKHSNNEEVDVSSSVPSVMKSIEANNCETVDDGVPPDSMSRSWHEDIPEQNEDFNNLHSNSVGAHNNDKTSNIHSSNSSEDHATSLYNGIESDNVTEQDKVDKSSPRSLKKNKGADTLGTSTSSNAKSRHHEKQHNQLDNSQNCDNLSEASNDSGKGGSVQDNANSSPPDEDRIFEFNIPSNMCGLFIGSHGKTIKNISQQSGTRIRLQHNPYTQKYQICIVEGTQSAIDRACSIIKRKFPSIKFPGPEMGPPANPVIMPEIMQLSLPEGVSVDIVVSSIVDAGRIFLQQPTHPTFPSLDRLNTFMNTCYMQDGTIPDMPRPIETGVICAAPMLNGWYRAQIMATYESSDECDIKYVDYGGYSRVSTSVLKQIRSDFMTLPFEAVECYMANITQLETEAFYSTEAAVVLEELTQGKLLQAQVVGRAEDGIPYISLFQIQPNLGSVLVNREMVNSGVVRWMDQLPEVSA